MPRPTKKRRVNFQPGVTFFKPRGIPLRLLQSIILQEDELEAIRLADAEGLYHTQAAKRMRISRQTFGNILRSGRNKVAIALTEGRAIQLGQNRVVSRSNKEASTPE